MWESVVLEIGHNYVRKCNQTHSFSSSVSQNSGSAVKQDLVENIVNMDTCCKATV